MQEMGKADPNSFLRKFYTNAGKCSLYSKSALVGIPYGIARHLQQEKTLKNYHR